MKILKRIAAIMLATGVLLLSGCDNQTVNSSGSSESSESVSDLSSAMTSESGQQEGSGNESLSAEDIKKAFLELSNAVIQDMTKIDENTLLAIGQHNLVLADTNTYKIFKEIPRTNGMRVQKIDNGFVTVDIRDKSCSIDVYDVKGNIIRHVPIPMRSLRDDELEAGYSYTEKPVIYPSTLLVSSDAKNICYYCDEGFCANSIEFNNEIIVQPTEEFNGEYEEFHDMGTTVLYKEDLIYGTASKFNSEINKMEFFFASINSKTKEWTIYCKLNDDQQLFAHPCPFVDNSFIIVDAGADQRYTEGKLPYMLVGDKELKEFVCERNIESVRAFISANVKYILTTSAHISATGQLLGYDIKLYDVKTGEILLTQDTDDVAITTYIDEDARKLYVVCGTEFSVLDF